MTMEICPRCSHLVKERYQHQLQDGWDCDGLGPRRADPDSQRILNALGHENAEGTILCELKHLRHEVRSRSVERPEYKTLEKLLLSADERESALRTKLAEAEVEVQFFKTKADEWERAYRQHMEGCHDASTKR